MSSAFCDELSATKVIDPNNSKLPPSHEILVVVGDANWKQLIRLTLVWTAFHNDLWLRFSEIPVCYLSFLASADEFVIVSGGNAEAINATHALSLICNPFLTLEVPAEYRLVSCTRKHVDIVREYLNPSHASCMLLQVGDQLPWSDFPNSALSIIAAWANKFWIEAYANGCNSILMSIINLPQKRRPFYSKGPNLSVWPSWYYDFICKLWAHWENSLGRWYCAPCNHRVIIAVPESQSAVFRAGSKLVWDSVHIWAVKHWLCVVLAQ